MRKSFILREVTKSDWRVLLEWRNDKITRQNFFNSDLVSVSEHKEYIKNTITNPNRTLFILEYNEIPVGTIREDRLDKGEFELSYTISPMYRGKKWFSSSVFSALKRKHERDLMNQQIKNQHFSSMVSKFEVNYYIFD